ncbi:hypothetical protein JHK85_001542 [Glycine max]|nr:hypothetical protein JHK85_001542 [Glycine max]
MFYLFYSLSHWQLPLPHLTTTIFAFSPLPHFLAPSPVARLLLLASALEVYLMAIMSVAIVVSVVEESREMDLLMVPYSLDPSLKIIQWPSFLLASKKKEVMTSNTSSTNQTYSALRVYIYTAEDKSDLYAWGKR